MPQIINGQEYHDDGTYLMGSNIVYLLGDNAHRLTVVSYSGTERNVAIGDVYNDRSPWWFARIDNESYTTVVPCDCPRHRGTVVYHNAVR